ncbi:beta-ketoacyl-[acyl-carrier-protein] synthase II [Rathayibacter sp. AY1G1]|jgi:3-oxoacyl-[acyl-carrier-protein] synthase II|uniref:beta-ketoacyl-[acyl-carrier-protein] synthase family protein n=1 Tax=unclassified Rathayibacter TaxID=2609250 RepID=UPI000CE8C12F|nr:MULTISPECIES: beta-ketoacyl-ACP synthase II [unclassified Rathayibacter]PPF10133.1 beta-ketoacyl-[acyl-carrier-protein] synthase II [Rathayibacter sp. AY1A5]PPF16725.1 beta-ketoacyl-[acyl-carrier-protein] synthase II [Rathayibacter sp. AY1A4]PPF22638.1 beta-ketoacyl-[acyl-carrier-protein] synthase II [Rathayibacter sp. AY1A7]PPF26503.1 beta-ketoacyl-[acyl-carrier-protein] synthase II [Rathayibacter sp. AY1F2]PPF34473.1 beta-ketoacyl-[acyl-carrier-protein] synthase II [Rathayibacter sp. AY1A
MTKKIVVTGIGASTPLGGTARESWNALLAGESGVRSLEQDWVAQYDIPVTFAAQAKVRPEEVLSRPEAKRLDPSSQFALISAREAWADSGITDVDPLRVGVDYSTGIGGLWTLVDAWDTLRERGPRRVLPMTIPMLMPNAAAAAISMAIPSRAYARTDVSACASSTEALANAYEHMQLGLADVVVAGGTESVVHPLPIAAFASMQALSRRNDDPATASRPYDVSRDGFVLGEGAATLILETEEHALARGARIYAELAGGAVTSDSYHITAPDPEGSAAARAMIGALEQAGAALTDVTHVNAHATSTPVGDIAEYRALLRVFGDHLPNIAVSATKASTGHLLGGTGALEAIFTVLALHERTAPPTINLFEQDPQIPLDVVTSPRALGDGPLVAISNSFGFGGHNAVAAFRTV